MGQPSTEGTKKTDEKTPTTDQPLLTQVMPPTIRVTRNDYQPVTNAISESRMRA